jgi:DMSO reductase family type II enzyme heme b subunit
VSLQFPPTLEAGPERPYFLLGDASSPVYLLGWQAGKGATEATASGPDKVAAITGSEASAKVAYDNGQYRLVLKRPLRSGDANRLGFEPARFIPIAFGAWDGGAGETGTKMSLTSWYYLRLDEPRSNRRFIVPPLVALGTLAVMGLVVWAANRRR